MSGSDDNLLIAWSRKPGEELRQFKGHTHWVTSVLQTEDGYVVSGSRDCTCKVWNLDTGECLFTFEVTLSSSMYISAASPLQKKKPFFFVT